MTNPVKRSFAADLLSRTDETDEGRLNVSGHAAVFNQRTLIGSRRWGFVESIAAGAFDDVLENDVRYLENHHGAPFARTKNNTLRLGVDATGLTVDADLNPEMQQARDHYAAIKREDMDQMSFAFTIGEELVRELPDDDPDFPGMVERVITRVDALFDVSGVTYPAYEGADVGARDGQVRHQEIEELLARAAEASGDENENASDDDEETETDGRSANDDELLARLQAKRATRRQEG